MAKATVNLVTTVGAFTGSGDISFPQGLNLPSGTTVEGVGLLTQNTATTANIGAILNAGVNGIAAALGNKQYTMTLLSNTATFSDSRAVYNGISQAAITAGVYTPGIAINAIGIGMGANRPSDGQWVNTVYIDASTGSATFLGTLTAGSVISGSVTNSGTGNSLNTIDGNASTALSNANTALTTKLNKNAADVLGGNITFTTSGAFQIGTATWNGSSATGTGIMYNQYGIVAVNAGTIEFVLNGSTGSATFAGSLNAATGTFAGQLIAGSTVTGSLTVSTAGSINSGQTAYNTGTGYWLEYNGGTPRLSIGSSTNSITWDGSVLSITGAIQGASSINITGSAIFGGATTVGSYTGALAANTTNAQAYGIIAYSGTALGAAIIGEVSSGAASGTAAVVGTAGSVANAYGLYGYASNTSSYALYAEGPLLLNSQTLPAAAGYSALFTTLPWSPSSSYNSWLQLTINNVTCVIPIWVK